MLKDACNNEQFEIDKNKELLEDLRVARRNTSNLNDFDEFTKRYDDLNHYIKIENIPLDVYKIIIEF